MITTPIYELLAANTPDKPINHRRVLSHNNIKPATPPRATRCHTILVANVTNLVSKWLGGGGGWRIRLANTYLTVAALTLLSSVGKAPAPTRVV